MAARGSEASGYRDGVKIIISDGVERVMRTLESHYTEFVEEIC